MTTEYQDSFLPPSQRKKAIITTTRQTDPYHPLKGTKYDIATFKKQTRGSMTTEYQEAFLPPAHRKCVLAPPILLDAPKKEIKFDVQPAKQQTRDSLTTEYQESFLPPYFRKAILTTTRKTDPYHPLKGTRYDIATVKFEFVTHKFIQSAPKVTKPSVPIKDQRCNNPQRSSLPPAPKMDYTTVYKSDFPAWKTSPRQPCKAKGRLIGVNSSCQDHQNSFFQMGSNSGSTKREPFENTTSYRLDYVAHPLQPRRRR